MNATHVLWMQVAAQLLLIGMAWTAAIRMSREYRSSIVGLVAFNLALGLSLLLIGFRGTLPYFLTHSLANLLGLWAIVAVVQAGSQLLKIHINQMEMWLVMGISGFAILGFGLSEETANLRVLSLSLAISWLLFRAGFKTFRLQLVPHLRRPVKSIGFVCVAIGSLLLLRGLAGAVTQESIEFTAADRVTLILPFLILSGASLANLAFAYLTISTVVMKLRHRARSDELTGLLNRKAITDEINHAWMRAQEGRQAFALISLDIDNLRNVNAVHGYPMGDALLTEIAKALLGVLRPGQVMGRAGGGKMIAVLPQATLAEARVIAEVMRGLVADMQQLFADQRVTVTASLGVAVSASADSSAEAVLARANTQLEYAKTGGRNRVHLEGVPPPRPTPPQPER